MILVLDTGVLGGITNPKSRSATVKVMTAWAADMRAAGHVFAIPAIADYEVRRELPRCNRQPEALYRPHRRRRVAEHHPVAEAGGCRQLRQTVDDGHAVRLIHTVYGRGYVLRAPESPESPEVEEDRPTQRVPG